MNNPVYVCRDLLLIPHLRGARLLAGERGLQQPVTRVNVMEVPDVVDWVRPGEFLMTTGYPFRDRPEAWMELIPQLAAKQVAALGIKTKRFLDEVPRQALELAEQYSFPIIELPPETSFSDVVREVMERVLAQEARYLMVLQNRVHKLSSQLLYGGGLNDFLNSLDQMLNNPVVLLDSYNRLLLSPGAASVQMAEGDIVLPLDGKELRLIVERGGNTIQWHERAVRLHASRINEHQHPASFLVLLEWNQECNDLDALTIERVGVLVGLEMLNAEARRAVESKYIDQFLHDWLTGRIMTKADLQMRADACGVKLREGDSYSAQIIRWDNVSPDTVQLNDAIKQIRRNRFEDNRMFITLLEGELVVLSAHKEHAPSSRGLLRERIARLLRGGFPQELIPAIAVCAGKTVDVPELVHNSFRQAQKVLHICRVCGLEEDWIIYEELGGYQLLYLLPDCQEVDDFKRRWMEPLLDYDLKHNTLLIQTLKVYFRCNENIRRTAQELITHYNTVVYRMDRIKELLGIDLTGSNDRLQLQLALLLYEMNSHKPPLKGAGDS